MVAVVVSSVGPASSAAACFTLPSDQQIIVSNRQYNIHGMTAVLTGDIEESAVNANHLLVHAIDDFKHGRDSILSTAVDLVKDTLKGTALIRGLVSRVSNPRSRTEELAQVKQLLSELRLSNTASSFGGLLLNSFKLLLVGLLQLSLLADQAFLVIGSEALELGNLFLDLSNSGLEGRLLQGLSLLINVDLLLRDELVQ